MQIMKMFSIHAFNVANFKKLIWKTSEQMLGGDAYKDQVKLMKKVLR